jgi:hypothetical protein
VTPSPKKGSKGVCPSGRGVGVGVKARPCVGRGVGGGGRPCVGRGVGVTLGHGVRVGAGILGPLFAGDLRVKVSTSEARVVGGATRSFGFGAVIGVGGGSRFGGTVWAGMAIARLKSFGATDRVSPFEEAGVRVGAGAGVSA